MKKKLLFILIFIIPLMGSAKMLLNLSVTRNPEDIIVYGDKLFVRDQYTAQIYSITDGKFLQNIGAIGEGPGEYRQCFDLYLTHEKKLVLISFNKAIVYDLNGKLLYEKRTNYSLSKFIPIGKKMVVEHFSVLKKTREYQKILYIEDQNLKPEIELHRMVKPNPRKRLDVIFFYEGFYVYKHRIYLAINKNGQLLFRVFDANGIKKDEFTVKSQRLKVPDEFIAEKKEEIKNKVKKYWPKVKSTLRFKEYFPPIQDFKISSGYIYIKTWNYRNGEVKFKIIDLRGEEIGEIFLPKAGKLYDIANDFYYYVKENLESEEWEVHALELN